MTYSYFYKTPDGQRHEATLDAPSREEAFSVLRAQGIRPIKVVAADGSKANGEVVVKGIRKRMVALISLAVALLVTLAFLLLLHLFPSTSSPSPTPNSSLLTSHSSLPTTLDPETRRELQRLEEEKRRAELAYREKMIDRVKKGTLSRETANEIFRAMSLPELP